MLEGEPTWLAAFGPSGAGRGLAAPALSFRRRPDGYGLDVELGALEHRPRVATRDDIAVVFDGLLLDRSLVTRALRPREASEGTEAEFVLRAYLELGERALPLLRGVFVLVVWDGRRETALFVRDPTGSHPLFFSRDGDRLIVGASHGALLDLGRVPLDIDRVALARWVVDGSMRPQRTFYERIERLPPGHVLAATRAAISVRRYWHPRDSAPRRELTPSEAVDHLRELLDQAVARYANVGRIGIFLSGGVDSAAVAASAAGVTRERGLPDPLALSLIFPTPEASEEEAQAAIAASLGIRQVLIPLLDGLDEDGLLAAALGLTRESWTPCVNPWEVPYVRVAGKSRDLGCDLVLTGEGGNDWFEAEAAEAADLIRALRLVALIRMWSQERQLRRGALRTTKEIFWVYGLRPILRRVAFLALTPVNDSVAKVRSGRVRRGIPTGWAVPDPDLRAALADDLIRSGSIERSGNYREAAANRRLDAVHLVVPLENRFLFSRKLGVHLLDPLLDPDLVAFLFALPGHLVNFGGRAKGLAAESVRRRVGESAATFLDHPQFDPFFRSLMRRDAVRALDELGGLPQLAGLGVVDKATFARALRAIPLAAELSYYQAWQTLACEAWLSSRIQGGRLDD